MGKYFRDISIHLGSAKELPTGISQRDFNLSTHTVQDIFYHQIPKKFVFANITKLNIELYKNPLEKQIYNEMLDGIVVYKYANFDFDAYWALNTLERNRKIQTVLKSTIKAIGKNNPKNRDILISIIDSISDNNFSYQRPLAYLSKNSPDRRFKSLVSLVVNDAGQNAYLDILDKEGKSIHHEHLLQNVYYEIHDNLYKARWVNNTFEIIDRKGKSFKKYVAS